MVGLGWVCVCPTRTLKYSGPNIIDLLFVAIYGWLFVLKLPGFDLTHNLWPQRLCAVKLCGNVMQSFLASYCVVVVLCTVLPTNNYSNCIFTSNKIVNLLCESVLPSQQYVPAAISSCITASANYPYFLLQYKSSAICLLLHSEPATLSVTTKDVLMCCNLKKKCQKQLESSQTVKPWPSSEW